MATRQWMALPSGWILQHGLAHLPWRYKGEGSDNTAALMVLTAIAHAADEDTGIARVTYDELCKVTGLSRTKLSKGLNVLKTIEVITSGPDNSRSTYQLSNYDLTAGWAKFPVKSMYAGGRILAFDDFHLRKAVELHALKLFFLFAAFRDKRTNVANIGYEKIHEYTGIKKERIKTAISFLASLSLVYVEQLPSKINDYGISNTYRIVGVEPFNHRGTTGRSSI